MALEPCFEPRVGLPALARSMRVTTQRGKLRCLDPLASASGRPQGGDLGVAERTAVSDGQCVEADGAHRAAVQVGELEVESPAEPANLMMLAAVERELELRVIGRAVHELDVFGTIIAWTRLGHREQTRIV